MIVRTAAVFYRGSIFQRFIAAALDNFDRFGDEFCRGCELRRLSQATQKSFISGHVLARRVGACIIAQQPPPRRRCQLPTHTSLGGVLAFSGLFCVSYFCAQFLRPRCHPFTAYGSLFGGRGREAERGQGEEERDGESEGTVLTIYGIWLAVRVRW